MESRAHALAAGIFTLLLTFAVVLAVWWLSGKREAVTEYVLVTQKSVNGLNPQAQVRYRGIRAGKVLDIDVDDKDPRNILVRINLNSDMLVTRNTTAGLAYQGVTGLAYVMLDDNGMSSEPLKGVNGELPRITLKASSMDSLVDTAADTMVQVRQLAERANTLLSEQNVKRVGETLAHVEDASASLQGTMRDTQQVMAALKQTLSEENIKRIHTVLANVEKVSGEAAPLAVELRGLVSNLQGLSKRLDQTVVDAGGELATGTLPRTNQLLQELSRNSRQLSQVLEQIERSPQMFIFGRAAPSPGPGEQGYSGPH